jgi:hypothetical protein
VVLGWPGYVDLPVNPLVNYLLTPRRDAVRREMQDLLGPGTQLSGWYLATTRKRPPA